MKLSFPVPRFLVTLLLVFLLSVTAKAQTGTFIITSGPGAGKTFTAVNGVVNSGGVVGLIENHGGSFIGPHFHGTINGLPDPNPMSMGWGPVAPFNPTSTFKTRDHLAQTANPHPGGLGATPPNRSALSNAIAELDASAAVTPILISDIAGVGESSITNILTNPNLSAEVKTRLDDIFTKYKGTGDIAGVAEAIFDFDQWYKGQTGTPYYEWAGGKSEYYPNAPTVTSADLDKFKLTTQLACYEFVHFCAYIASDQRTKPGYKGDEVLDSEGNVLVAATPTGQVSVQWGFPVGQARATIGNGSSVGDISTNESMTNARDNPDGVQRGQIVTGIGLWANNSVGYNHVAVSIGNGQVISLGSGGLKKEALGGKLSGCFWALGYSFVYAGDYQYNTLNPAPANPTVPISTPPVNAPAATPPAPTPK